MIPLTQHYCVSNSTEIMFFTFPNLKTYLVSQDNKKISVDYSACLFLRIITLTRERTQRRREKENRWQFLGQIPKHLSIPKTQLRLKSKLSNAIPADSRRNARWPTFHGCVRNIKVGGSAGSAWKLWRMRCWDQIVSSPPKKLWTAISVSAENSGRRAFWMKQSIQFLPWVESSGKIWILRGGLAGRIQTLFFPPLTIFRNLLWFDRKVAFRLSLVDL